MHSWIASGLFWFALPAAAFELHVEHVQLADLSVHELHLSQQAEQLTLELQRVQQPVFGIDQQNLRWSCALSQPADGAIACLGAIRAGRPAWSGRLDWEGRDGRQHLRLASKAARIEYTSAAGGTMPEGNLQWKDVPLSWLYRQLSERWPELATVEGSARGSLQIEGAGDRVHGSLGFERVAFDSRDGSTAATGLGLSGRLDYAAKGKTLAWHWLGKVSTGEVLFGAVYFAVPEAGAELAIDAQAEGDLPWQLARIGWHDGLGLDLEASAKFAADGGYRVQLGQVSADLARVAPRYLKTWLATAGFAELDLGGRIDAQALWDNDHWQEFKLKLQDGLAVDRQGRIDARGLFADLAMDASAPANTLGWSELKLFGIPFGAAQADWSWSPQQIDLSRPLRVDLLGGRLVLPRLQRLPADRGLAYWQGALDLEGLSLNRLATALGWPGFGGSLSGRLPQFRLQDGALQFDGDLELQVFDGTLRISNLASERSFGVAPSLSADLQFDNLDLGQLSSAFAFGEMQGWLDGSVTGLRLLDWTPVAFDARLRTDGAYPGKQRLSRRAVQGISSVAGSAGAAANPLIGMFDSFGYKQIGINCRLIDNVCQMSGLEPSGNGYTIVKGAGLPRLNVIAFQQRVDWPVLVERLRAVAGGQAPRVE